MMATHQERVVLTNWEDMIKAGYPQDYWKKKFRDWLGATPRSLHMNTWGVAGFMCLNQLDQLTVQNIDENLSFEIGAERTLKNTSDSLIKHKLNLTATHIESCSVTVTKSSEFTFGNSISFGTDKLGIGGEMAARQFNIKNEVGSTCSVSTEVHFADIVEVELPPHSAKTIRLMVQWNALNEELHIPITIDGLILADNGKQTNGGRLWGMRVSGSHGIGKKPKSVMISKVCASFNASGFIEIYDEKSNKPYYVKRCGRIDLQSKPFGTSMNNGCSISGMMSLLSSDDKPSDDYTYIDSDPVLETDVIEQ